CVCVCVCVCVYGLSKSRGWRRLYAYPERGGGTLSVWGWRWCVCVLVCVCARLSGEVPSTLSLQEEMLWLKQSLSGLGSPVVLCHNDLLCKNIIYGQTGGEFPTPCPLPHTSAPSSLPSTLNATQWN